MKRLMKEAKASADAEQVRLLQEARRLRKLQDHLVDAISSSDTKSLNHAIQRSLIEDSPVGYLRFKNDELVATQPLTQAMINQSFEALKETFELINPKARSRFYDVVKNDPEVTDYIWSDIDHGFSGLLNIHYRESTRFGWLNKKMSNVDAIIKLVSPLGLADIVNFKDFFDKTGNEKIINSCTRLDPIKDISSQVATSASETVSVIVNAEKSKTAGDKLSRLIGNQLERADTAIRRVTEQVGGRDPRKNDTADFFRYLIAYNTGKSVFDNLQRHPEKALDFRVNALIFALKQLEIDGVLKTPDKAQPTTLRRAAVHLHSYPNHAPIILEQLRDVGYDQAVTSIYNPMLNVNQKAESQTAAPPNDAIDLQSQFAKAIGPLIRKELPNDIESALLELKQSFEEELALYTNAKTKITQIDTHRRLLGVIKGIEPEARLYSDSFNSRDDEDMLEKLRSVESKLKNPASNINEMMATYSIAGKNRLPKIRLKVNNFVNSWTGFGAVSCMKLVGDVAAMPVKGLDVALLTTNLESSIIRRLSERTGRTINRVAGFFSEKLRPQQTRNSQQQTVDNIKYLIDFSYMNGGRPTNTFFDHLARACDGDTKQALLAYAAIADDAASLGLIDSFPAEETTKALVAAFADGEPSEATARAAGHVIDDSVSTGLLNIIKHARNNRRLHGDTAQAQANEIDHIKVRGAMKP